MTQQHMPTPEQIRSIGEYFLELAKDDKNRVAMGASNIFKHTSDLCDTVACHAGWYATKLPEQGVNVSFDTLDAATLILRCSDQVIDYQIGIEMMQKDLGFRSMFAFLDWADIKEIWGNPHGDKMFDQDGAMAFGLEDDDDITLRHIGRHWLGVSSRQRDYNQRQFENNAGPFPEQEKV